MKTKLWKVLPIALFTLGIAATPLAVIACSSTDQPATPEQTPETTKNVYQPSPAIQAKFSKADFDIFTKGWESFPIEGLIEKFPLQLIGNKLTMSATFQSQAKSPTSTMKMVYTLASKILHEVYYDDVLDKSEIINPEILKENIREIYDYVALEDSYQPSDEIKAKFSIADFKILSKGFLYYPIEPYLAKREIKLINDKLIFPFIYNSVEDGVTKYEGKSVIKLSYPYDGERWENGVLVETITDTLENITEQLKKYYDYGVNPNEPLNYYQPSSLIGEKFTAEDFIIFSENWKLFVDSSSLEKYPAVLSDNVLSLPKAVKDYVSNERVRFETFYDLGGAPFLKETYSDGVMKSRAYLDIETLTKEMKLLYDFKFEG